MSTVIRAIRLRRAIAADLDPDRFVTGLAEAAHRAMFGPIDGVNVHHGPGSTAAVAAPAPPIAAPPALDRTLREQGRLLRERLLAGAVDVFVGRGYHDTRVDDIVDAAGVSHGSFYRYFANKEELFRELAASAANAMLDLLDQLTDADSGARQDWAEQWFDTYAGNGAIFGIWAEQSPGAEDFGGLGTDVAMAVRNRLSGLLAGRSGGDPDVDAIAMLALLEQAPTLVRSHGVPERRAVHAMVTVIGNAFAGRLRAP
jgi:AcrR family transcriptional regulator